MSANWFSKFFPAPEYLKRPVAGLDLSDRSVKFITITDPGRPPRIFFGERDLPVGLIVAGRIQQPGELASILKELRREWQLDYVITALPEEQAYVFRLQLPFMKREELRSSIELQLEDYVPLVAAEAVFDYEILSIPSGQESTFDLGVVAIPQNTVQGYLEVLRVAGFQPLAFEVEGKAVVRAVVPREVQETFMVIDIGRTRTSFFIAARGTLLFTSTIETISGDRFTQAVQKNLDLPYAAAERLKVEQGLLRVRNDNRLFFALLPLVSVFKDEIMSRYSYWNNSHLDTDSMAGPIRKILICGGQSTLPGLLEYLGVYFEEPVELADVWVNSWDVEKIVPPITFRQVQRYTTALGLALRHFNR